MEIIGDAAFEGYKSSVLMRQKLARNAKIALHDLCDEDFAAIVIDAIRKRDAILAERIIDGVTK